VLPGQYRRACYSFGQQHVAGECAACQRRVPIKKGYCRLCWMQASLEASGQVTVLQPFLERIRWQQLRFADMQRPRQPGPRLGMQGRRRLKPRPTAVQATQETCVWTQLRMIELRRDHSRFDRRRHGDYANPALIRARQALGVIAEARGWTCWVTSSVDRALVILLSGHLDGEKIAYSEAFPVLRRYGLSVGRTVEILQDVDLFDDNRTPVFESWLERKLCDLAPGIRCDVEHWLRTLHDGGPRTRARDKGTAWGYLSAIRPVLLDWSTRYDHLREVKREDILAVAGSLQGSRRHHTSACCGHCFATARGPAGSLPIQPPGSGSAARTTASSSRWKTMTCKPPSPLRPNR
jgi:hypothetical protein